MRDWIYIGESPPDEQCYQLGDPRARAEQRAYIEAIRKKLGQEPAGAQLAIRDEPGGGPTVVCYYEDTNKQAIDYAYKCESDGPMTWAEVGMQRP